jgi:hypothetical protein
MMGRIGGFYRMHDIGFRYRSEIFGDPGKSGQSFAWMFGRELTVHCDIAFVGGLGCMQ